MIGKFEELTLLAVMRTGPSALPATVYERLRLGQHKAAFAATYTTLGRLADKGLLDERRIVDESGRDRRTFTINGAGQTALSEALSATQAVGGFSFGGGYAFS